MSNDPEDRLIHHLMERMQVVPAATCLTEDEIAACLDRSLIAAEVDRIETHLLICKSCREQLASIGEEIQALSGVPPFAKSMTAALSQLQKLGATRSVLAVLAAVHARRATLSAAAAAAVRRDSGPYLGATAVRSGEFSWPPFEPSADTFRLSLKRQGREVWTAQTHRCSCILPDAQDEGPYRLEISALRQGRALGVMHYFDIEWLSVEETEAVSRQETEFKDLPGPEVRLVLAAIYETHGLLREAAAICTSLHDEASPDAALLFMSGNLSEAMGLFSEAAGYYARGNSLLSPDEAEQG